MTAPRSRLPLLVTLLLIGAALWYGPIAQLPNYHDFADRTSRVGIPHFADVVSNLAFALVALYAGFELVGARNEMAMINGWGGYRLFLIGLLLTAVGSSYYHLDTDNARLV